MNHHPIDLADARQHAALLRIAAECRIPWTVAIAHAWVSPDGETVGVTLRAGDYAQAVRARDDDEWVQAVGTFGISEYVRIMGLDSKP